MDKHIVEKTIQQIVDKKIPVYFISPHLDDALLSAGGLISYLSDKTKVTVITLFTEASKHSSLSARVFVKQCGYTDAQTLFADRRKEDIAACESIGVSAIHLGYKDALWREKRYLSHAEKIAGSVIPEAKLIYPTYRFHMQKGIIAREDYRMIDEIGKKLQEMIPAKSIVFGPLGMGNHVDHLVTKQIVKKFFTPMYWFDQPYARAEAYKKYTQHPFAFSPAHVSRNKEHAVAQYKTQIKALFGSAKIPDLPEYIVPTDIIHTTFPFKLDEYYFIQELDRNDGKGKYLYGLFCDAKGKRGFAKQWNGTIKDKNYLFLKNEERVYRVISPAAKELQKTKVLPSVSIPELLAVHEEKGTMTLLTEYKDGENLVALPARKKAEALDKSITYFEELNKRKLGKLRENVFNRKMRHLMFQFPIIVLVALLRHPQYFLTICKTFFVFLMNIPFLVKHKQYGLIHRDLGEKNILVTKTTYAIHDLQLACYADKRVDLATTYLKTTLDSTVKQEVFEHVIKKRITDAIDARVFYMYCLYFGLYEASMLNNKECVTTIQFIDDIFAKMNSQETEQLDDKEHVVLVKESKKNTLFITSLQWVFVTVLFAALVLFFSKGAPGPQGLLYQTGYATQVGSPFESSNSTSRYALVQAIVDNHSFLLTRAMAQFAAPDVSYYKGKYFSLFTPGVSLISAPFYILGKILQLPELLTFFSTDIIAIVNVILIAYIVKKISRSFSAGVIGGLSFLFGTNALAYSQTLTQHHLSVLILLLAVLNALSQRTISNNILFGVLYGIGLLVDIPNAFLLFPALFTVLYKEFSYSTEGEKIKLSLKMNIVGLALGLLPLVGFFCWYNFVTTGSYTKLAQFIGRTNVFNVTQQNQQVSVSVQKDPPGTLAKIGIGFVFQTRSELKGMYTLLVSNERSWWYYSPVVFLGLLGFYALYKNRTSRPVSVLLLSTVLLNILLYSMFGDPWGGWSFGPRYLIPAEAILAVGIGVAVYQYKRKLFFISLFALLLFYSVWVNVLGAITTASIPPRIEAEHLTVFIPYTYKYNLQLVGKGMSSSLLYNMVFSTMMTVQQYLSLVVTSIFALLTLLFVTLYFKEEKKS